MLTSIGWACLVISILTGQLTYHHTKNLYLCILYIHTLVRVTKCVAEATFDLHKVSLSLRVIWGFVSGSAPKHSYYIVQNCESSNPNLIKLSILLKKCCGFRILSSECFCIDAHLYNLIKKGADTSPSTPNQVFVPSSEKRLAANLFLSPSRHLEAKSNHHSEQEANTDSLHRRL